MTTTLFHWFLFDLGVEGLYDLCLEFGLDPPQASWTLHLELCQWCERQGQREHLNARVREIFRNITP